MTKGPGESKKIPEDMRHMKHFLTHWGAHPYKFKPKEATGASTGSAGFISENGEYVPTHLDGRVRRVRRNGHTRDLPDSTLSLEMQGKSPTPSIYSTSSGDVSLSPSPHLPSVDYVPGLGMDPDRIHNSQMTGLFQTPALSTPLQAGNFENAHHLREVPGTWPTTSSIPYNDGYSLLGLGPSYPHSLEPSVWPSLDANSMHIGDFHNNLNGFSDSVQVDGRQLSLMTESNRMREARQLTSTQQRSEKHKHSKHQDTHPRNRQCTPSYHSSSLPSIPRTLMPINRTQQSQSQYFTHFEPSTGNVHAMFPAYPDIGFYVPDPPYLASGTWLEPHINQDGALVHLGDTSFPPHNFGYRGPFE